MPTRLPKGSGTSHNFIRSVVLLLFAITLVGIFLFHQPQANDDIGQSKTAQVTKQVELPKTFWQALTTDPTAFFTLGIFIIGSVQAGLFYWQLDLIRKSLADTEKVAKATKRQARLARDSLIASQRAWIKAEIKGPSGDLIINDQGVQYAIGITLTNTGNIPAQDITFEGWIVGRKVAFTSSPSRIEPLVFHQKKCVESREIKTISFRHTLFPAERFPDAQGYSSVEIGCKMTGEELFDIIFPIRGKACALLYVGGAVNYQFGTDKRIHQTSFLYELTLGGVASAFEVERETYSGRLISLSPLSDGDGRRAD